MGPCPPFIQPHVGEGRLAAFRAKHAQDVHEDTRAQFAEPTSSKRTECRQGRGPCWGSTGWASRP